jgi:hypothetical protein
LWIVVFELPTDPIKIIAVSLTTKREPSDLTVVLSAGEHKFVTHDTVVSYADSRAFLKSDLVARIEQKFFEQSDPCSEEMLAKIQHGLLISPFTPNGIKRDCTALSDKK